MFLVAGTLALILWRAPGTHASPLVIVDQDGAVNATYAPYAVLAALGYGAVGLAGIHAYNLWSPIIKKNDLRTAPDPALAYSNREKMRDWLQRVVGLEPGRSPVLEDVRGVVQPVVSPLIPFRRQDEPHPSVPVAVPAPRPVRPVPPQKKRRNKPRHPFVRT